MISGEARPPIRKPPRGMIFPGKNGDFFAIMYDFSSGPIVSPVCNPNQQLVQALSLTSGGILQRLHAPSPMPQPSPYLGAGHSIHLTGSLTSQSRQKVPSSQLLVHVHSPFTDGVKKVKDLAVLELQGRRSPLLSQKPIAMKEANPQMPNRRC